MAMITGTVEAHKHYNEFEKASSDLDESFEVLNRRPELQLGEIKFVNSQLSI